MWSRAAHLTGLSLFGFLWTKWARGLWPNAPSGTNFACNPVQAPTPLFTVPSSILAGKSLWRLTWLWNSVQKSSYYFIACWRSLFSEFMLQKSKPVVALVFQSGENVEQQRAGVSHGTGVLQALLLCPRAFSASDNSLGLCGHFPPSSAWQTQWCFLWGCRAGAVCSLGPPGHCCGRNVLLLVVPWAPVVVLVFARFFVWQQAIPTFSSGDFNKIWGDLGRICGVQHWAVDVPAVASGLMAVTWLLSVASGGSNYLSGLFPRKLM